MRRLILFLMLLAPFGCGGESKGPPLPGFGETFSNEFLYDQIQKKCSGITTGDIHIDSDSSVLDLGDTTGDYTIGWDGSDAVHTITAGDFAFIGGKFGIGTASPGYKLDVQGGAIRQQGSAGVDGYLLTNSGDLLSTTNLNPGILVFHGTAGNDYGMDLGYNAGYRTRIFTANSTDIAFGKLSSPATAQSDFTEWMTIEAGGNVGIGITTPHYPMTVNGGIGGLEKSADPAEPAEGEFVIWMSDGTAKGDDGDVLVASKAGGVTKWTTLFDHSAGAAW